MRLVLEKRERRLKRMSLLIPLFSFILSLLIGAIVLAASKADPIQAYAAMAKGAIRQRTPLPVHGCRSPSAPYMRSQCRYRRSASGSGISEPKDNSSGERSVSPGSFSSGPSCPDPLLLPAGILVGMIAGALWAGIPGVLKAYWAVDETLTTLMLNYVAIGVAEYLYIKAWKAPKGILGTPEFPEFTQLSQVWGKVHSGVFIALALVVILWFLLYKTTWGFELNMIGKNPVAARYQGVSIEKSIVIALLISGAIAGLAGSLNNRRHHAPPDPRGQRRVWFHRHHHCMDVEPEPLRIYHRRHCHGFSHYRSRCSADSYETA